MPAGITHLFGPNTTGLNGISLGLNLFFSALQANEFFRAKRGIREAVSDAISHLEGPSGIDHYVVVTMSARQSGNDVRSMQRFVGADAGPVRSIRHFMAPSFLTSPGTRIEYALIYNANSCPAAFIGHPSADLRQARDIARRLM